MSLATGVSDLAERIAEQFNGVFTGPTYAGNLDNAPFGYTSFVDVNVTNDPEFGNGLLLTMKNEDDSARVQVAYSIVGTYAIRYRLGGSWGGWLFFFDGHPAITDISGLQTALDAKVPLVPRVNTTTSSATPAINTDTTDLATITELATAITSMTTGLTGTPVNGQRLTIRVRDNGTARAITWGASFVSSGVATLLSTTVINKTHSVALEYDSVPGKWVCLAVDSVGY